MGVTIAQTIHAAGESAPAGGVPSGTHAVALAARSEDDLLRVESLLQRRGIPHKSIREPDAPYFGQLMAVGLYPVSDRKAVRKVLGNLPLLR